ncbi:hypothetical protein [Streptomyces xantholiticus]|uniref:hypothetical protein n=1 Tax=Streptomyces xantholiticus TaxID=68285 RepID=UPI001671EA22|nr:hypothetical protein [Streptomyces xantholiticus]GGW23186.1 hypothetical protein GCM10010381_01960 [Streptomyces xantholiticus]
MSTATIDDKGKEQHVFDRAHWQDRLDVLRSRYHVPGAALAVLVDGEIHELVSGVLHRGAGDRGLVPAAHPIGLQLSRNARPRSG